MYKLEINGQQYPLDREWDLRTWMALHKWDVEQTWTWPKIIELASGAPAQLVADIDEEIQHQAMVVITANMVPNWAQLKTRIGQHRFIDLDDLTIGQFIDLEVALGRGLETNLDWLISVLYNCDKSECLKWNYEDCYAALQTWFVKRKNVYDEYADLFTFSEDNAKPVGDPGHAWYDLLMTLANEEFLNIQHVVERPLYEALNYLAWRKDQARKQELEQKKLELSRR